MRPLYPVALCACVLLLAACGGETETTGARNNNLPRSEPLRASDYAQCDGRPGGGEDQSREMMRTIELLVPNEEINCTDKRSFSFGQQQVSLVYIAYGTVQDCAAGCFSRDLCAIYDEPNALLYEVSESAKPDRPGLAHGVTGTAEFREFRDAQRHAEAPWRFCFD